MDKHPFFSHLRCRECGRHYPRKLFTFANSIFGPLEAAYDYDAIRESLTAKRFSHAPIRCGVIANFSRSKMSRRSASRQVHSADPRSPFSAAPRCRLKLYLKNDTVNYPTLSFKDRVVAVALSRAKELGIDTVACASTGNLANSVAANAAAAGLRSFRVDPGGPRTTKILGSLIFGTNVIRHSRRL